MSLGNPVGKLPKATAWKPGKSCKDVNLRRIYCRHIARMRSGQKWLRAIPISRGAV